jgi:anti-sigma factor RsiW
MNCLDYENQLGDFVDGTLDSVACESLEAHLRTCDRCRALVADFQTIRFATLAMEPAVPPPSAWAKIAARIDEEARPWWHFGRSVSGASAVWQPIAALGMALVLTASLTWLGSSLAPAAEVSRQAATTQAPLADVALDTAEKDYAAAIAGLEQITRTQREALDPGTAEVLQVNLTSIDTAIGESRAALATEPDNDLAIESLFEALKRKLALLQDAVALINEMRKGNSEGAARIVSGLNQ